MIKTDGLTPEEKKIIIDKGTEACCTSFFDASLTNRTYICRNCGIGLFSGKD